ncbi:competence type IV pilus major pilin ComGC [Leuconostoc palmae]|uniref:competence type IV pilus major pilin ComGC n=1 Tax=Leuconostoc palmae TaxID=501487 RepID=UPI001C7D4161|nr:prepilin-type N-terminal cleavage/methylation domain-containing protein [Leuconostoc palmae]
MTKKLFNRSKLKAFTLIEAAIVLFIISLLMLLVLPNLNVQRKKAMETHKTAMIATVQSQVDMYVNMFPEKKNVTVDDLHSSGYLTERQVEKIKELNISVTNNEAHQ